jgi:hypothetical protein
LVIISSTCQSTACKRVNRQTASPKSNHSGMRGRTTHLGGGRLEPGRRSPLVRQRRRRDTLPAARRRAPAIRTHEIHSRSNEWRGREGERLTRGCAYAPWRRIGVYLRRRRGGGLLLQRRRRRREGERRRVRR